VDFAVFVPVNQSRVSGAKGTKDKLASGVPFPPQKKESHFQNDAIHGQNNKQSVTVFIEMKL